MKIAFLGKYSVFNAKVLDQTTIDKNKLPDLFRCYNSSFSNILTETLPQVSDAMPLLGTPQLTYLQVTISNQLFV